MKLENVFQFCVLLVLFNISRAELIRNETIPTVEFKVLDYKTIEFLNPFRQNAKLKFSFEGGNFTYFEHTNPSLWILKMHNNAKNALEIGNFTLAEFKKTHFAFDWRNIGGSIADAKVCFEVGYNNASWFSTYLEKDQPFPLNIGKSFAKALPLMTGGYGLNQLGPVVNTIFFTTDGFAIEFTHHDPSYIQRINNQLCFTTKSIHPPTDKFHFKSFHFDLFAAENIKEMYKQSVNNYLLLKKPYMQEGFPNERMFNQTIFNLDVKHFNQTKLIEQAKQIQKHGLKNIQLVLENWEAHLGDVTFDKTRFPDPKTLIFELHKLGFLIKLVVNSFVSDQSELFKSHKDLLIKDPHDWRKPLLFNWTTHKTGSLIDYLNYYARSWLAEKLTSIHKHEGVDSYRIIGGELGQFGLAETARANTYDTTHFSNKYTTYITIAAAQLGNLVEIDAGYQSQDHPIFIRMRDIEPNWNSLKSVIPTALTMSLDRFSFVVAPTFKPDSKVSEELYIRWIQLTTFLPSMQISVAPWNVSDKTANLTTKYIALHLEHSQTIVAIAKKTFNTGEPLIRPLWYLSPDDSKTYAISDQFAVGNDLIVAPVLVQSQKERDVYLPSGTWLDQHGKSYSGSTKFKILASIEELPFFKRKIE